ncbi:MAG TPA: response regulator transcription factor [Silvibacterium sp.]|jgi:DNA-binding response OmpR family regulator|nr:response regulator transcription factor [Silvibacterium sp.]
MPFCRPRALFSVRTMLLTSGSTLSYNYFACYPSCMRVLVVEDEVRLADNIAAALREGAGFAVDCANNGEDGAMLADYHHYDLILLDLMLPKLDGFGVVHHLRRRSCPTPILVLTAVGDVNRKIDLINAGADDYLTKPFDLGELIARCKALIRRSRGTAHPVLTAGTLTLNNVEQIVRQNGKPIDLSPTEYRILEYLMYRPRAIVSKRELLEHLYDFTWEHHSNVVEVHVSNLRKKLNEQGSGTSPIETIRGRGYRLLPERAS